MTVEEADADVAKRFPTIVRKRNEAAKCTITVGVRVFEPAGGRREISPCLTSRSTRREGGEK